MLPFKESKITENLVERYFSDKTNDLELTWHRDLESRVISPVFETDWKIQLDDELPQIIRGEINIAKGQWHRLIKGTGDLVLKITKYPEYAK